ncbi:MAG: MarR family transcriptional regulator [Mycobacteriales bacterium]
MDRAANLLGALALAVGDRQREAVAAEAGGESAAAALSALLHFLDAPSVDLLRQVLGLTHSGAVRLIDRLEEQGLVTRGPGPDGRTVSVTLTAHGRRTARRVGRSRARVLDSALGTLTPAERATLDRLTGKVLAGLVRAPGATRWTCRLCDTTACGRDDDRCPVANAAQARYGGVGR